MCHGNFRFTVCVTKTKSHHTALWPFTHQQLWAISAPVFWLVQEEWAETRAIRQWESDQWRTRPLTSLSLSLSGTNKAVCKNKTVVLWLISYIHISRHFHKYYGTTVVNVQITNIYQYHGIFFISDCILLLSQCECIWNIALKRNLF